MWFVLVTLLLASVEPFFPFGSVLLVWSSTLGTMKSGWGSLVMVLLAGILRDTVLVSKFGVSSAVFVPVWAFAALIHTRLERPLPVALLSTIVGSVMMGILERGLSWGAVVANLLAVILAVRTWGVLAERHTGIRLRGE